MCRLCCLGERDTLRRWLTYSAIEFGRILVSQNRRARPATTLCESDRAATKQRKDLNEGAPELALVLSLAYPVGAQEALTFGSPVTGDIAAGESRSYTFAADAGDEIAGPAELLGSEGALQFLDGAGSRVAGTRVRQWYLERHCRSTRRLCCASVGHLSGSHHRCWNARRQHTRCGWRGSRFQRACAAYLSPRRRSIQANAFDNSPVTCSRAEVMR